MIDLKGVVHFSIPVSDLAVSRKFYMETVGLKLVRDAPAIGGASRAQNDAALRRRHQRELAGGAEDVEAMGATADHMLDEAPDRGLVDRMGGGERRDQRRHRAVDAPRIERGHASASR